MCIWLTKKQARPKKSRKDRVVYKYMDGNKDGLKALLFPFPYRMNEVHKTKMGEAVHDTEYTLGFNHNANYKIEAGFYSYARPHDGYWVWDIKAKCIIPKGSMYVMNNKGEIVSDTIKIIEILEERY